MAISILPSSDATAANAADVPPAPDGARRSVEAVYERLAPLYDVVYGVALRPGRRHAMRRLAPAAGERVLEVGTGTALSALDYPAGGHVVAVDLSQHMLSRAGARLQRHRLHHVTLCRMDAAHLALPDDAFDAIYAPYVINVVDDPVRAIGEMRRVCRPGGRIVLLNHFRPSGGEQRLLERLAGKVAASAGGANWDLDLDALMAATTLTAVSVERVNLARVSSVVVCRKP